MSTTPMVRKLTESENAFMKRFVALGLMPAEAREILREIIKWKQCMGEEETVRRLKTLKQYRLNSYLGRTDRSYVKRHRDGTPKGPFRVLWRNIRRLQFRKVWNCLMAYSGLTSAKITNRQWKKFEKGVLRDPADPSGLARAKAYIRLGIESWKHAGVVIPEAPEEFGDDLFSLPTSDSRVYPTSKTKSKVQTEGLIDSAEWFLTQTAAQFYDRHELIMSGVTRTLLPWGSTVDIFMETYGVGEEDGMGNPEEETYAGRLSVVQEPGYKGRFIASPASALQAAAMPLYSWSRELVRQLPGDYSLDQEGGINRCHTAIKEHGYAFSIDLEGATDNFPRELVLFTMQELGLPSSWRTFYEDVCKLPWVIPPAFRSVTPRTDIAWSQGQPLGWYPVFNLALCISLGALTEGVCSHSSPDADYSPGQVSVRCGDDLVIFEEEAGNLLIQVLEGVGIPISKEKSIESSKVCEFCSRLITTDGVIPAPKWKSVSDENFLETVRSLGKSGLSLINRQQRAAVRWLAPLPAPWGLGWNPRGIPASVRFQSFLFEKGDLGLSRGGQLTTAGLSKLRPYLSSQSALRSVQMMHTDDISDQEILDLISVTFGPNRDRKIYGPWIAGMVTQVSDLCHAIRLSKKTDSGNPAVVEIRSAVVDRLRRLIPPFLMDDLKPAIEIYGEEIALWSWYESAYRWFAEPASVRAKEKLSLLSLVDLRVRTALGISRERALRR